MSQPRSLRSTQVTQPLSSSQPSLNSDSDVIKEITESVTAAVTVAVHKALEEKLVDLFSERFASLENEIARLNVNNSKLQKQIDAMESYSRRDNLVFTNVCVDDYASVAAPQSSLNSASNEGSQSAIEEQIINFCNGVLEVEVSKQDISVAHRLGSRRRTVAPGQTPNPSRVIVRFTSRRIRDRIYAARSKLKNMEPKMYVNEHLSAHVNDLFTTARQMITDKLIYSAWTFNGNLFVKLTTSSTPQLIVNKVTLDNITRSL